MTNAACAVAGRRVSVRWTPLILPLDPHVGNRHDAEHPMLFGWRHS